jgi:hypothetical protein
MIKTFAFSTAPLTRTAWAVFKYCGTKTVTLRIKKNMKRLSYNLYQKKQTK